MLWKTPAALCPMISKYREIVGPGNSSYPRGEDNQQNVHKSRSADAVCLQQYMIDVELDQAPNLVLQMYCGI